PTGHASAPPRRQRKGGGSGSDPSLLLELATAPPAVRSGFVSRPALAQGLADAQTAALALIVAPPGYGKSTLLAEWADHDNRPFVWLALGNGGPRTLSALTALPPWGAGSL